ncbi:MAG: ABC transporter substrate-binding protein [bacterium]|nr:ABC transporter substrate-binding protein [bacterium]
MKLVSLSFALLAAASGALAAGAPMRVATLVPYVADALVEIGGNVDVVASVRRSMHETPDPKRLDLGNPHNPNIEKLVEARPTLVVADAQMHGARRDDLARGGAEVLLVESDTLDHTFEGLLLVGRKVGAEPRMAALVETAKRGVTDAALPKRTPALVLFGAPGSFLVVSNRTWIGDLASQVGYDNVGAAVSGSERFPGFVQVSDEVLAGMRPEVVMLVAHGDPEAIRTAFTQRLEGGGPWAGLRGAATGGVHVLPSAMFSINPGLAMPEAAKHLHDLAAPKVGAAR